MSESNGGDDGLLLLVLLVSRLTSGVTAVGQPKAGREELELLGGGREKRGSTGHGWAGYMQYMM